MYRKSETSCGRRSAVVWKKIGQATTSDGRVGLTDLFTPHSIKRNPSCLHGRNATSSVEEGGGKLNVSLRLKTENQFRFDNHLFYAVVPYCRKLKNSYFRRSRPGGTRIYLHLLTPIGGRTAGTSTTRNSWPFRARGSRTGLNVLYRGIRAFAQAWQDAVMSCQHVTGLIMTVPLTWPSFNRHGSNVWWKPRLIAVRTFSIYFRYRFVKKNFIFLLKFKNNTW